MLALQGFDHIHIYVADRAAAERWYARVMGLRREPALEHWAVDGGPLTLGDAGGSVHLALFERPRQACRSVVALRVGAPELLQWQAHLQHELGQPVAFEDHGESWSLYFSDPDGNPYEITSYEVAALKVAVSASTG